MKRYDSTFQLSAGDLAGHLGCRHLTQLDKLAAEGRLEPPAWRDPMLAVLQERGVAHEDSYLEYLRTERGLDVLHFDDVGTTPDAFERTKAAMREGAAAIAQAVLIDGRWRGRADVLLRVERPSDLGAWSYEVVDTKLANETRGGTVLQLCLYSDLLSRVQGLLPESMCVVKPGHFADPERFRVHDFLAYCRLIRARLERAIDGDADAESSTYPDPVPHCDVCRWWPKCDRQRHDDDHLSLVAGVTRLHQRELQVIGIDTVEKLARVSLPIEPRPARGSAETYEKGHHQARLQVASRPLPVPLHEILESVEPGCGLSRLPEPSPGDVFLDLEGDPFVESGGREYLFGWVILDADGKPEYHSIWALDASDERPAFEQLIDALMARWSAHPDFHVYHFAPYDPAALKRLMGRYATREEEIDRLLRGERFVDLFGVVRQGVRVGIESYSLKDLELLHGFAREQDLREATAHRRRIERALELADVESITPESRAAVELYNREDCLSAWSLRDWLERVRGEAVGRGATIPRPELGDGAASEALDERQQRLLALFERLTNGVPPLEADRSEEQKARWLLAHLLEWHRRENKATWWEYFRLCDLDEDGLREERAGLAGLEFVETVGGTARCPIHRYRFAAQDHDIRAGAKLQAQQGKKLGEVVAIDLAGRLVDVKKRGDMRDAHPRAVFAHDVINAEPLPSSIERLAEWVANGGVDAEGKWRATRDLLLRLPPRLASGSSGLLRKEGEELLDAARRLALDLDGGVLAVQGPPGSGKTYMGARMICALVRAGKRVGVTAVSHKVIRNLLEEVASAAREGGQRIALAHKIDKSDVAPDDVIEIEDNKEVLNALRGGSVQVVGGTPWLWARDDSEGVLDVLVVDEAGQMSLANTLAAASAARSLILLGDPQQLEQPIQGAHPEGSDVSALHHLLGENETIPDDQGLFLAETWRLHPEICRYTSEIFYEGRLESRRGCEQQRIDGPTPFAGSGLWLVAAEHQGNQSSAPEEVAAVARVVDWLLRDGVSWINSKGEKAVLTRDGILIVAPYNAQVALLSERLPGMRVGTVDKFQGQEAPVVIYSMTTSSPEDAPRGMEFLYSLHRLNVATSRARCASILVATPRVLEAECRTPHQMRLANALCRFAEFARMPQFPA